MSDVLPLRILGTGEALPQRIVPTAEVAALCGVPEEEAVRRSGVLTRRWLADDEDPLELGLTAARQALAAAGIDAADVDVVLNASGTQLQAIPDGGALIAAGLGLEDVSAYSMHATCLSFLFALQEAGFLLATGRARHVLIVSTEGGSRGIDFGQPESALLFGDAAAAIVVGPADASGQGIVTSAFKTQTTGVKHAEIRGFGSRIRIEQAQDRLSDFKFDMHGGQLLVDALRNFPRFLEGVRPGLSKGLPGVDRVVPHQTSKAGIEGMARLWGRENMVITLPEVGNTIGSAIPLALHRAKVQEGESVLLVGTGAGTHYGAVILQC
ncbi:3-oxoacyl-[acyl-carrier-protein] synthase-3 [Rathayibacter oskolensis]|uniref:3-oxoacyl-[acyl-carrier-protein] synthase-3 n=1 Tax=Rathayibacter oskolensis TaxID=1891671 RepID=A0A1X7PB05_9MICO|nr:3-oxoacyl-[acyl-carrier-protein] synthase III C-terminal domain-containing protein [Rathayibacter oskolensis]SMH48312.1 3-oxoacyl-[acyl-carrier-protein] synthase-3 [Rathayibacter oskolensis]